MARAAFFVSWVKRASSVARSAFTTIGPAATTNLAVKRLFAGAVAGKARPILIEGAMPVFKPRSQPLFIFQLAAAIVEEQG
ncbi:hypothetical protein [Novosphingobium sp.]|uniref:hypothetical protein n=1 Tax=Novosphingobium sp. TaxID=1874826 RepID=UPI0025FF0123|nr:hypothetical protein [Novosphingobium sp.]